jgi:hypothetical protein
MLSARYTMRQFGRVVAMIKPSVLCSFGITKKILDNG